MESTSPYARRLGPIALDAILVVVFATIGARTHHDGAPGIAEVADVAWPFLVGLGVAYAIGRVPLSIRFGLLAWAVTVAVGMLLRQLTGDGTAFAFIVVATLFNLVTLVGWRLVSQAISRRNRD